MSNQLFLSRLRDALGPAGVIEDPDIIAPHLTEWRGRVTGETPALIAPATVEETAAVVALCNETRTPLTVQGGNTGLVCAQTPRGEMLLSLKRMRAIRSVDAAADSLVAEAGAPLTTVHEAAESAGRSFPLSLGSQGSATIGGLISTNAGGVHVLRHGMMRSLVHGVEAVLPNGAILRGLTALRKDNTGYDIKHWLIGAEGTLGVITAAALKLSPLPAARAVALCAVGSADKALELLEFVKARNSELSAFEFMSRSAVDLTLQLPGVRSPFARTPVWTLLIEFDTLDARGFEERVEALLSDALEQGLVEDVTIARSEQSAIDFWRLRESLPQGHRLVQRPQLSFDISTPVSASPRFLAAAETAVAAVLPGAETVAFGHAGDGNVHYTVIAPEQAAMPEEAVSDAIHGLAVSLGGSISAEHGIGVSRIRDFRKFKDPTARAAMRAIKLALDPNRILNPRVLLGDASA